MLIRSQVGVGLFGVLGALACSSPSASGGLHQFGPAELDGGAASSLAGNSASASGGTPAAGAGDLAGSTSAGGTSGGGTSGGGMSGSAGSSAVPSTAGNGGSTNGGGSAGGAAAGGAGGVTSVGGSTGLGGASAGGTGGTGGQILSRGKAATADSEQTANSAAMGNDGMLSTRWCAADGATGHYWQVDLGQSHALSRVAVTWEKLQVYQFKVEGSADQKTWTMLSDQTASTDDASDQSFMLTGAPSARYVKVTVTGLNGGVWASFFEFSVYGF